jgi:hypothetical protein
VPWWGQGCWHVKLVEESFDEKDFSDGYRKLGFVLSAFQKKHG